MSFKDNGIDKPQPNCGVVGVFNHPQAATMAYYALHALQHRGQEAAGIVSSYFDYEKHRNRFAEYKDFGLVLDVFSEPSILTQQLKGSSAIAHNRYSTTGSSSKANIQPFTFKYRMGNLSIAHNGNLTNTVQLRDKLQNEGAIFHSSSDSELFLHLIARSKKETQLEQIREALQITEGAFSIVILTETSLIAACDPHGFRPLSIGRKKIGDTYAYFVASETCAFDIVSAEYIRPIKNNELVVIDRDTLETGEIKSFHVQEVTPEARHCIFEYVYFSRPDSKIWGENVDKVRRKCGKNLAVEQPINVPTNEKVRVIPVPDSANTAALGYAKVHKETHPETLFEIGLIRSHYVGRTFIAPDQDQRELKVKTKFNTVKGVLENRNVVLIDDSIVRGTTSRLLINLLKEANPKRIDFRISSPMIKFPCRYGMDFPSKEELIANHYETEEDIAKYLGVDTLHYLSKEKLIESAPSGEGINYCTACFTGIYPVAIDESSNKFTTED